MPIRVVRTRRRIPMTSNRSASSTRIGAYRSVSTYARPRRTITSRSRVISRVPRIRPIAQQPFKRPTQRAHTIQPPTRQQLNIFGRTNFGRRQQPIYQKKKTITPVVAPEQPSIANTDYSFDMAKWQYRPSHLPMINRSKFRTRRRLPLPKTTPPPHPLAHLSLALAEPLKPTTKKVDMFDKQLRTFVVSNYILNNNGLNLIGGGFKKASDFIKPIDFPEQLLPIFAISIRYERYQHLLARLGPWAKHVQYWPGTYGDKIDRDKLISDGVVVASAFRPNEPYLRRGEIGCYDAHLRLWKHIAENKIQRALILEDDADIQYSENVPKRISKFFADIQRLDLKYDLLYLGHNDYNPPTHLYPETEIGVPSKCQGLFSYVVTFEGVQKLIKVALPMGPPVDIRIMDEIKYIRQLSMEPRLNWVVNVYSETNNIV